MGKILQKFEYAKSVFGNEIKITDVFEDGAVTDVKTVTKGKGFQGPVKRFGVAIRESKSEKTIRGPGSLGGWKGHGHSMYRIAHAGQMGYHRRTEYNKQILKISDNLEETTFKGGIHKFGNVKNTFILVKGSVGGAKKRLIRFNVAIRKKQSHYPGAPEIKKVITRR